MFIKVLEEYSHCQYEYIVVVVFLKQSKRRSTYFYILINDLIDN